MSIIALVILYFLGAWQFTKFQTKSAFDLAPSQPIDRLIGTIETHRPIRLYGLIDGKPVWRLIKAIKTDQGDTVFAVIAGIEAANIETKDLNTLAILPTEKYDAKGWLKPVEKLNWFSKLIAPPNIPETRIYHTIDIPEWHDVLGHSTRQPLKLDHVFEPFELIMLNKTAPNTIWTNPYALVDPDPLPPERHLGYAWTWWGMALVLIAIYVTYHHNEGRLRLRG